MPPLGPVARHVVGRVIQARRLDPSLTYGQAARELGISVSSLYNLRTGRSAGKGLAPRLMGVARTARGQPQSVRNSFHVTFETADGTRVASRNIDVSGTFTQADALLMRHDPKIRRGVQRQLAREATADERQRRGSPRWTRRERAGLRVTKVEREVQQRSTPWFFSRYDPGEIKRFRR